MVLCKLIIVTSFLVTCPFLTLPNKGLVCIVLSLANGIAFQFGNWPFFRKFVVWFLHHCLICSCLSVPLEVRWGYYLIIVLRTFNFNNWYQKDQPGCLVTCLQGSKSHCEATVLLFSKSPCDSNKHSQEAHALKCPQNRISSTSDYCMSRQWGCMCQCISVVAVVSLLTAT